MAADPKRRMATVAITGGTVSGAKGLLEYLFGTLDFTWQPVTAPGVRKRPYGSRQASNARAGRPLKLRLDTGEVFTIRTTATDKDTIRELLSFSSNKISNIWTERGTLYGPTYAQAA